ncbi:hypothetical protein CDD83_2426 [Cordyceps sp. RAO-2017]|nr:hypothetical protein CDD83_2426 [Cordyceps sp. RAO-2017]
MCLTHSSTAHTETAASWPASRRESAPPVVQEGPASRSYTPPPARPQNSNDSSTPAGVMNPSTPPSPDPQPHLIPGPGDRGQRDEHSHRRDSQNLRHLLNRLARFLPTRRVRLEKPKTSRNIHTVCLLRCADSPEWFARWANGFSPSPPHPVSSIALFGRRLPIVKRPTIPAAAPAQTVAKPPQVGRRRSVWTLFGHGRRLVLRFGGYRAAARTDASRQRTGAEAGGPGSVEALLSVCSEGERDRGGRESQARRPVSTASPPPSRRAGDAGIPLQRGLRNRDAAWTVPAGSRDEHNPALSPDSLVPVCSDCPTRESVDGYGA